MKKKVLWLCIQIAVVAMALVLTVSTYAWYVSQTTVHTSATTVTAAAGSNTFIEKEEDEYYTEYMGETGQGYQGDGNGGVDAPYMVRKQMTITFSPANGNSYLVASLLTINVDRMDGGRHDSSADETILKNFTWRIEIDGIEYAPDEKGFAHYENDEGERVYYAIPQTTTVDLVFVLIYQSEADHQNWLAGDYDAVEPFAYCDYAYMRAVFTFTFEIGMDVRATETP